MCDTATRPLKPATDRPHFLPPSWLHDPPPVKNEMWAHCLETRGFPADSIMTFTNLVPSTDPMVRGEVLPAAILQFMQDTHLVATAVGVRAFDDDGDRLIVIALLTDAVLAVGHGIPRPCSSKLAVITLVTTSKLRVKYRLSNAGSLPLPLWRRSSRLLMMNLLFYLLLRRPRL